MVRKKRKGFSLLELLASLPIFALMVLGMSYVVNSYSEASIKRIQLLKCEALANNILTYFEIEQKAKLGTLDLKNKYANAKPDNIRQRTANEQGYEAILKKLDEKNEYNQQLYSLTTSYGEVSVVVKTYIPDSYFE